MVVPSGLIAKYKTRYVCPVSLSIFSIWGVFQIFISFSEYPWVLTNSLTFLANIKLHTCDPASTHLVSVPVIVFQNLIVRSAVPPPDTRSPCWWGDQARAFTAAVCFKKEAVGMLDDILQRFSLLSLPPEANCCPSNDHFNPQTSCLWPVILFMYSSPIRISRRRMFLSREPLANTLLEFHAIAPTRPVCPRIVWIFLSLLQSQSWTSPEWVPTPRTFELGVKELLVTRSLEFSSSNFTTFELFPFQMYTLLLRPTLKRLLEDQSSKFK